MRRTRLRVWGKGLVGAITISVVAFTAMSAGAAGAAGTKLTPVGGNASGGKLEQQAAAIAKTKLVGPKGTGLTRGITSSSISIGCVYSASSFSGYATAIQGAFDVVNKAGGINGRQVTLVPCKDDAGVVQTNVAEVQQVVSQNQVFAVLSLSEVILAGSTNYLSTNQVPFYGWGFNPGFCGTRWGFGWNGCLGGNDYPEPIEAVAGNLAQAILAATGMKASSVRFAVQGDSNAAAVLSQGQYTGLMKALGAKVVYAQANFPTTPGADVTPYVSAMMASNPNVVYLSTPFADVGPIAAGLKAAGYKGAIMDFTNYIPGLLAAAPQLAAALQGEYVNTQVVPQEQNTAYVAQEKAALVAAGAQPFLTLGASVGYAEATELIEQLQAVGKNLNTKTFDQKINGGTFVSFANVGAGGLGKLKWPAAHYIPSDCAAIAQVSGTNFNVVAPFKCYNSYKVG